jgi:beta-galactosidase GanA
MTRSIVLCATQFLLAVGNIFGQTPMPKIIEKDGRHALLVDGKPFFILGGQAHNSSAWPGMMPEVWSAVEKMHLNTLEVPIYWEQVEPQQGNFDFSMINTLLVQAREHKVRLVLLWFATWKNGSNHYMPGWMKRDAAKYPNITGKSGEQIDSPSPLIKATLDADIKAFTAMTKYLKSSDPQHTVIMMQVENESGSWGSVRDYSPLGQQLFEESVPAELLKPEVLTALNCPVNASGTWKKVFGDRADEYFQAWYVARFIGQVAAAGKAEYPLPMYVNAALRDPLTNPMANNYESGGPTDNVIPIWKTAAPALDLVAPDIYLSGSERVLKVLNLYDRSDNTLFVPEAGLTPQNAKYFYEVLAHGGIGFSPFGIDDNGQASLEKEIDERLAPFAQEYAAAAPMINELAEWSFEGRVKAAVEREDHAKQTIELGAWQAIVSFGGDGRANAAPVYTGPTGKAMFVQLEANKFIVSGTQCHITFKPAGQNENKAWQYLAVEEGQYKNGKIELLRILNGDETDWGGPGFGAAPTVLRITLVTR